MLVSFIMTLMLQLCTARAESILGRVPTSAAAVINIIHCWKLLKNIPGMLFFAQDFEIKLLIDFDISRSFSTRRKNPLLLKSMLHDFRKELFAFVQTFLNSL